MSIKYNLIKLNKTNFNIWYFQIKNVFESESIDHLLSSPESSSTSTDPSTQQTNNSLTDTNTTADKSKIGLAKSIIQQALDTADLSLILHLTSPLEIIEFFKKRQTRTVTKQSLNDEFSFMKWSREESADDFIAKLTDIQVRMTNAGIVFDETRFISKLLTCLPSFMSDVGKDYEREDAKGLSPKYEDVKSTVLKIYDNRLKLKCDKKVMLNKNKDDHQSQSKLKLFCKYCKKKGHTVDQCFKLKKKQQEKSTTTSTDNQQSSNSQATRTTSTDKSNNTNNSSIEIPDQFKSALNISNSLDKSEIWEFDSDCAYHMSPNLDHFETIDYDKEESFMTGNGITRSKGIGSIKINSFTGKTWIQLYLHNVRYVPSLPNNLFSEPEAQPQIASDPKTGKLELIYNNQVLFTGHRDPKKKNVPYVMNIRVIKNLKPCNLVKINADLLHKRMAHCPMATIKKTIGNELVSNVSITGCEDNECEDCLEFKMKKKPNSSNLIKTKDVGSVIHCDSFSPKINTLNGLNTAMVFVDEASRYINVQLVRNKSESITAFNRYLAFQKEILKFYPNRMHSDNGTEYVNNKVDKLLDSLQIGHSFSVPYVKQENGLAEATIKHLSFTANAIMNSANLPRALWNEIFQAAAYLINIRYKNVIDSSPYFLFHGTSPSIDHLRILGAYAYVHIPLQLQSKFGPKSRKMRLVNYTNSSKIMRFWQPGTKIIQNFHDFTFLNDDINYKTIKKVKNKPDQSVQDNNEVVEIEVHRRENPLPSTNSPDNDQVQNEISEDPPDPPEDPPDNQRSNSNQNSNNQIHPKRRNKKRHYQKVNRNLRSNTRVQANCLYVSKYNWKEAELAEVQSLINKNTWVLEYPPSNAKIIKCSFVYATKLDPITGKLICKARCCAKGYQQIFGLDYLDTYAPTINIVSLKIILILIAKYKLKSSQFDVSSAFLNAPLKETIYMNQPIDDGTGRKCRLLKSIYGLKQSASNWYSELSKILNEFGFNQTTADKCVFIFCNAERYAVIGIYVDDGIIASNCEQLISDFFVFLKQRFEIKVGNINKFIGIEIDISDGQFKIHQASYINKLSKIFEDDLVHRNVVTPLPVKIDINSNQEADDSINHKYRSLISSLLFLSRLTRPDIAYHVGLLSTKLTNASKGDLFYALRVLNYIVSTKHLMMYIEVNGELKLTGYADSNFGVESRGLSRSGCLIVFGNTPIGWMSRLQSIPAKSTTEAEWYAIDLCTRELLSIRNLLNELKFNVKKIDLFSDNQSSIIICNDLVHSPNLRTKHVERCFYYIQYYVRNLIHLKYIPTDQQPADFLTKSFSRQKHSKFLEFFNLK